MELIIDDKIYSLKGEITRMWSTEPYDFLNKVDINDILPNSVYAKLRLNTKVIILDKDDNIECEIILFDTKSISSKFSNGTVRFKLAAYFKDIKELSKMDVILLKRQLNTKNILNVN